MATRRKFLIGAAATTTGLAGAVGSATAQAKTFELELTQDGFVGRAPSSIEGQTNPTLPVEAGKQYAIRWTNSYVPESTQAGTARHNVVIATDDGVLNRSEYLFEEGVSQTVSFQATANLTEYFCEEHMGEGGQFEVSGGATATPTATPTEGGGGGGMGTATPTPTEGGGGGGEETNGGGPGFGVGAAVTAIGAAAYGALRNSDE